MSKDFNGHQPRSIHIPIDKNTVMDIDIDLSNPDEFLDKAKRLVVEEYNRHLPEGLPDNLTIGDVFIVWFSKTLQNWKALVATNVAGDGFYFEVTFNGDRLETYIDTYIKVNNTVVSDVVVPIRRKA